MRDLLDDIDRWRAAGRRVALARVIAVEGSGPRPPGAALAVSDEGEVAGAVSGGCVDAAVVAAALDALATGRPRVVAFDGLGDEALQGALTCGGRVRLLVEPLDW